MRIWRLLSAFICILSLLCITVSAHPGGTDSKGGHTNHSTGEYHYHHGYPEHDHYDMDGDGDIDCPYDFEDKTGQSGSGNSGNSVKQDAVPAETVVVTETVVKTVEKEVPYIPEWVFWVGGLLAFVILILALVLRAKSVALADTAARYRRDIERKEEHIREHLQSLHNSLVSQYGPDYLYILSGAPEGDYLDSDGLPHDAASRIDPDYDGYTLYLSGSTWNRRLKYHSAKCRFASSFCPINAYTAKQKAYTSCKICKCRMPDTEWVDRYHKMSSFLNAYIRCDEEVPAEQVDCIRNRTPGSGTN